MVELEKRSVTKFMISNSNNYNKLKQLYVIIGVTKLNKTDKGPGESFRRKRTLEADKGGTIHSEQRQPKKATE